jgi:hypothetical protein
MLKKLFITVLLAASATLGQNRPAASAPATNLPPGWEEIDPRFVFLTVRLASVETSLDAVNKAMKEAGYKQAIHQDEVAHAQKGNENMDRNAGGPAHWQDFYGKTAEKFFYHPVDPNSTYHTETRLTQKSPKDDNAPASGFPSRQGLPVAQRPPQFDYIYRANDEARQRAEAEIAKLAGKLDALTERRRQLETEQSALWCKIAFRAVSFRGFSSKAIYRFELDVPGTTDAAKQRQEAIRAATDFVRAVDHAMAVAEASGDSDPAASFKELDASINAAWTAVNDRIISQPTLMIESDDVNTALGKFVAAAKRLPAVTKNIAEAQGLAAQGDLAGDDQRKQTFRASLQQSLFDCATNLYTANDCVTALAKQWSVTPNVQKKIVMPPVPVQVDPSTTPQSEINKNERSFHPKDGQVDRTTPSVLKPPAGKPQTTDAELKQGSVSDLLPLINPQKNSLHGDWSMEGDSLIGKPTENTPADQVLEIPFAPHGEYDFKVVFARKTGYSGVGDFLWLFCAMKGKQFPFVVRQNECGFNTLGKFNASENGTTHRFSNRLRDGEKIEVIVKVRNWGVEGYVDGVLVSTLRTDYNDVGISPNATVFVFPHTNTLGLASHGATLTILSAQVTQIKVPNDPQVNEAGLEIPATPHDVGADQNNEVDLLSLINPDKNELLGTWAFQNKQLFNDPSTNPKGFTLIEVPYSPKSDYDVTVVFSRLDGDTCFALYCANDGKQFPFCVGTHQCGFEPDGKVFSSNQTSHTFTEPLHNGQRYEVVVKVRKRSIEAFIDGHSVSRWDTDYSDMGRRKSEKVWVLGGDNTLGFGIARSKVAIYSAKITEAK